MALSRKVSSHPADLRLTARLCFPGTARSRFTAMCLTTAMFAGPWPVRSRARSSWKTTSRTQCSRFSMPQWARTARAKLAGVEPGGGQIVAPLPLDLAAALGLALDHADHGEAGKGDLARVAPVREQPGHVVADGVPADLDPAVVAVDRLEGVERPGGGSAKKASTSPNVAGRFSFSASR